MIEPGLPMGRVPLWAGPHAHWPSLLLGVAMVLCGACAGTPLPSDLERAQRLERSSPEAARDAYRAIRLDCERSGRQRPRDDCANAVVREAQLEEQQGRWPEAYALWRAIPSRTTSRRTAARAMTRAAELASERLADPRTAVELAWRTVEGYPDEIPADDALALAVRLGRRQDPAALAARLDALWPRLARFDLGDNLLFARAELARAGDRPEDAVAIYDRLADRYPRSSLKDDALWQGAQLLLARGDPRGALRRLQRLVDSRRDAWITGSYNSQYLDDAQLLIGRIHLEQLGQLGPAIDAFRLLADDFADSVLRDDALLWLARAYLRRHEPVRKDDQHKACAALARLPREYPDGNQLRAAAKLAGEVGCP